MHEPPRAPAPRLTTHDDTSLSHLQGNFFIVSVIQQAACNLVFQYVVARFPALIATTRALGGAPEVVVRLFWFHELNKVRLVFRWLYVFSMGILAFEGASSSPRSGTPGRGY